MWWDGGVDESAEPIEIELTFGDDRPGHGGPAPRSAGGDDVWRPGGLEPVAGDDTSGASRAVSGDTGPPGADPLQVWVVVGIALMALVLGWMLGRSGGTETVSPTPATTAPAATVPVATADVLDPIAPIDGVTTTSPGSDAAATTTSVDPVTVEIAAVDPIVARSPSQIVAIGSGRRLLTLDLPTGLLTTRVVDSQPFGPAAVFAGPGWELLPSWDPDLPATLVIDGTERHVDGLGSVAGLRWSAGADTLWRSDDDLFAGRAGLAEEVAVDGTPTGVSVALPVVPRMADPAGGLVVEVAGGAYRVAPDAIEPISPGRLIALSADRALVEECDAGLVCGYAWVDRRDGARTPLTIVAPAGVGGYLVPPVGDLAAAAFSPDGSAVVGYLADGPDTELRSLGVIDVATGAYHELVTTLETVPFAWAPDGQVLFYLEGGRLLAYDRSSSSVRVVAARLSALEAFAVRAATGVPAG